MAALSSTSSRAVLMLATPASVEQFLVDVGGPHLGAFGCECERARVAYALSGRGDECGLALESHGMSSLKLCRMVAPPGSQRSGFRRMAAGRCESYSELA